MRTFDEINNKIKNGEAVVLTAIEVKNLIEKESIDKVFEKVDVVTTATFGPMCSSGAFLNFGHANPPIRMEKTFINNVESYSGIAAVDTYIGVTQESKVNNNYGGAHVIYDLICGKEVEIIASGKGTDCYPRKYIKRKLKLSDLNEAYLFNPRNVYQNYNAAINTSNKKLHTYMGILFENSENINFCTSGEISPLLNDPTYQTIGIGTSIFLAGATGMIVHEGTQFNSDIKRDENKLPVAPAATLAVIGDLKDMDKEYIKPAILKGYGISMFIGIGIPIPVLNKDILKSLAIRNKDIYTNILDYSKENKPTIKRVNYDQLRSGKVEINGKIIKTSSISSLYKSEKICIKLKEKILNKEFYLTKPIRKFNNTKVKEMKK
ncbi:uncharacterized protein (DUF39 family) [Oceanotoga teriensis]|jgi:uncharacterized protein (DUF39 family)|uniref:Uncharacterized protein (DUF39 family) n=1 Tax=Oceanotoga teriensis TaxID=515440 RepID=A0AA45HJY1_9BACT|nr:homocysteine biosynthesis protein [Oceanotoga teriensis]PWJ96542.1 uncharacterized protein (DUF39 family) [Oceanotoga teriensis]